MSRNLELVLFRLDAQRYALPVGAVERIVPAAEVTALPEAPSVVAGVINIAGRILPVIDLRRRFQQPSRLIALTDQFVIAWTGRRTVVLMVDEVVEVARLADGDVLAPGSIVPGLELIEGVAKLSSGIVLIHDLNRCLSLEEEQRLEQAIAGEVHGAP